MNISPSTEIAPSDVTGLFNFKDLLHSCDSYFSDDCHNDSSAYSTNGNNARMVLHSISVQTLVLLVPKQQISAPHTSTAVTSATMLTTVTPPTKTVVPRTPQPTVPVTRRTISTSTAPALYSDWTAWTCTENCGGCGIGRRTRICLSIPSSCVDSTVELNHQSCNQHPCPFGQRTCCVNYHLSQIGGRFVCIS
ncbi:unnamed protein product [Litomosoides sigmodontis]|uniref:Uncharacterized protein n=1 Tax=Litomosoides sigmodontis TaxID=42156 RepID=A0A3P6RZH9_LITSI|nr:unnamed protein product [Litomosoides sigmodontis]